MQPSSKWITTETASETKLQATAQVQTNLDDQSSKEEWRHWAKALRATLPDRSREVTTQLRQFLRTHGIRRVLSYYALPGEPNLNGLVGEFEVFTTRARFKPTPHLTIHPWDSATEMSSFGVLQPPKDAPQIELEQVQVILLPALAFDLYGTRLGYGGGFYDRLLPQFSGLTLGVTQQNLVVPKLPSQPHDCRVLGLATELGVHVYVSHSPAQL